MTQPTLEVEQFRDKLEAEFGLVFDEGRKEQVEQAFQIRRSELGLTGPAYLGRLHRDKSELEKVAALLTVPESYFFRHIDHFRAFSELVVPKRMTAHEEDRLLRVLCVGCASGEEPYTIAMTVLKNPDLWRGWKIGIRACDINPEALRHARRGTYTNWALRATPAADRACYFTTSGNRHRIKDCVRELVNFGTCNALELYRSDDAGSLDVVFFRNVLIYFSPEAIRAAINAVAHMLAPGGYLFLGPAETLRGISDDFQLCHSHETFYYQRKNTVSALIPYSPFQGRRSGAAKVAEEAEAESLAATVTANLGRTSIPAEVLSTAWIDEIERSTLRIDGLHAGRRKKGAALHGSVAQAPGRSAAEEIQNLTALLSANRYKEILDLVGGMPAAIADDTDVQLLRALAHLNGREPGAAEAVCRKVVERDSMSAAGHYILALCREYAEDLVNSAEHDRIAMYLDPTFAMPHMHLALIARRRGDLHVARREFENAALLLARESAIRLAIFAGGFSRDALRDLCRRELRGIGAG
jgi:chemotaxis protein methyltransferase CheR